MTLLMLANRDVYDAFAPAAAAFVAGGFLLASVGAAGLVFAPARP